MVCFSGISDRKILLPGRGSNGIELVFVDAGGILKKDPGGRTQALGIESTLDELYGKGP